MANKIPVAPISAWQVLDIILRLMHRDDLAPWHHHDKFQLYRDSVINDLIKVHCILDAWPNDPWPQHPKRNAKILANRQNRQNSSTTVKKDF